jgi:hypothetical protein
VIGPGLITLRGEAHALSHDLKVRKVFLGE